MNNYYVYMHICPNKKIYIGMSRQEPQKRWNYGNGYKNCTLFYKAIKKYGWNNIEHKILFDNLTKEEAMNYEQKLIKKYKSQNKNYGYNICSGGEGGTSHIVDKKLKEKISKTTKKAMANEEIREKIRKCHLGKKLSDEHKLKIKKSSRNYQTEKTKLKLRQINQNKIKVKCIETNIIYESIHDAGRITNISYQNIYKVCKKERNTAGGYHWEYEY